MALRPKQRIFISEYLKDFNATQAASVPDILLRLAYSIGQENLKKPEIRQAIEDRIATREEVLVGLTDIARGDMADLMSITTSGFTLELMIKDPVTGNMIVNPKTKLIKKIKQKVTTYLSKKDDDEDREVIETEIELYSRHDALRDMGKVHALFTDKIKVIGGWKSEIVALLKSGTITAKDVLSEMDEELAEELIKEAGVSIE